MRDASRPELVIKEISGTGTYGVRRAGTRALFGKEDATFMMPKPLAKKLMEGKSLKLVPGRNRKGALRVTHCEKSGKFCVGNGRTSVKVRVPKYLESEVSKGIMVIG